ncbi:hypothetical protein [Ascidiaceihabitans sp.]|uniref:hypothetical protein n=1 Tax=Ascidiaceihabitans sp. TaxID=1872644 RepID=UPI003298483F
MVYHRLPYVFWHYVHGQFYNRINYAGADEYFMGTMGIFCLWAAVLSYGYFTHPNLNVTKNSLTYRPFWSPKRHLAFHGIDHFVYRCEDIEPRSYLFGATAHRRAVF